MRAVVGLSHQKKCWDCRLADCRPWGRLAKSGENSIVMLVDRPILYLGRGGGGGTAYLQRLWLTFCDFFML